MKNYLKVLLFFLMTIVLSSSFGFKLSDKPSGFFEFPNLKGLDDSARIIFFHVPMAWLSVVAFFMSLYFGVKYLKNKDLTYDVKSLASLQLGLMFCLLATISGSIWAKFAWGSFWHWDPRETSIFILLLIYGALLVLRSSLDDAEKKAKLTAVYSIFAFFTTPFFVFIMPRITDSLHPGSAGDNNLGPVVEFKMNLNMTIVFYISLIAFSLLFYWLWNLNYRSLLLNYKKNNN
jgi:heme exporter protein C